MTKIKPLELASIVVIETITMYSGINIYILLKNTSINSWITVILSYIIGLIPIIIILYISNYKKELSLSEKIATLFNKKISFIINLLISIIFLIICITALYNINSFITSQFLYRTPLYISSILFVAITTYCAIKGINTITRVSSILTIINVLLLLLVLISLNKHFQITNLFPILKNDTDKIFIIAIKIAIINSLPILSILVIPKEKISSPQKYNKTIILSYIIGCLVSLAIIVFTIAVLGIYLCQTFEYPEYIVLKKVTLFGFFERIENIVYNQWLIGNFIYISLLTYCIPKQLNVKKNTNIFLVIVSIIIFIATNYIFKNNTNFNEFVTNTYPKILALLFTVYILLFIRIYIKKKKNCDTI